LGETFTDIDGDDLDVVVTKEDGNGLPSWATVVGRTVGCAPMIADTGCVTLVITATDPSGATASDTFDVCVNGYPTAIDNLANPLEISMYPNPTKGMVTVEFNTTNIYDIDFTEKVAIVMGNEHRGVSEEAAKLSDGTIYIPMRGMIQSLNVSVAAAVTLYEAQRQRMLKGMYNKPELPENELEAMIDEWCDK